MKPIIVALAALYASTASAAPQIIKAGDLKNVIVRPNRPIDTIHLANCLLLPGGCNPCQPASTVQHPQIRAAWILMGGENGALGCTYDTSEHNTPEGKWRKFKNGYVLSVCSRCK